MHIACTHVRSRFPGCEVGRRHCTVSAATQSAHNTRARPMQAARLYHVRHPEAVLARLDDVGASHQKKGTGAFQPRPERGSRHGWLCVHEACLNHESCLKPHETGAKRNGEPNLVAVSVQQAPHRIILNPASGHQQYCVRTDETKPDHARTLLTAHATNLVKLDARRWLGGFIHGAGACCFIAAVSCGSPSRFASGPSATGRRRFMLVPPASTR